MRERAMSSNPSSRECSDDVSVLVVEPNESENITGVFSMNKQFDSVTRFNVNYIHRPLHDFQKGKKVWVQILTIYAAAVLTYGCSNVKIDHMEMHFLFVVMTIITLVGASPFLSTHLLTATLGAFVGGHNIIGSVGSIDDVIVLTWTNYAWLFLLSLVVGLIWRFVMNSKWKVLDGFGGRLGTTVFLGMNAVMLTAYGPSGVVGWDRYYYGLTQVLNSAEDSIPLARAWFDKVQLAIEYAFAVIFLGVVAGGTRVMHNDYVKRLDETNVDSSTKPLPLPLNNVLVPVLWALLSMLLVIVSGYEHASVLFNGFAVGSFVAMASLQRISSIAKFAVVSVLAAGWGLALTPFFVGFPGKPGFTAMLGHVTWCLIEAIQVSLRVHRESRGQHGRDSSHDESSIHPQKDQLQQRQMTDGETLDFPHNEYQSKPKTESSMINKHQRRQQGKRKHLHLHISPVGEESIGDPPNLHHRAWSALKVEANSVVWHHSLKSRQEWSNLV